MQRQLLGSFAILSSVLLLSCRDAGSGVLPATSLGRFAADWLTAHNRAEGHAMVHLTTVNAGSIRMTGAQMDSTVYGAVEFARRTGRVVPVRVMHTSDTALVVLLRSADSAAWTARFKPAVQPSRVKVVVQVDRAWAMQGDANVR